MAKPDAKLTPPHTTEAIRECDGSERINRRVYVLKPAMIALLALVATDVHAQQLTIYDARAGKAIGRSHTGSQGAVTLYGADGRAVTREHNGTLYDTRSGFAIGRVEGKRR
jgi:hypothetical protein